MYRDTSQKVSGSGVDLTLQRIGPTGTDSVVSSNIHVSPDGQKHCSSLSRRQAGRQKNAGPVEVLYVGIMVPILPSSSIAADNR